MITKTAQELADLLHGVVEGDKEVKLSKFAKIEEGDPGSLTFLANPKYTHYIYTTGASACLVSKDFVPEQEVKTTLIRVDNPYECMAMLLTMLNQTEAAKKKGIAPTAVIPESAMIGEDVYIGPYVVIGDNAKIGNGAKINAHCTVGDDVVIGDDALLYPNVTIYDSCVVGARCTIHAGAVIGADGFGFAPDAEGHYHKIPQIGNVVLEDDVEVGANSTVDRATMGSTVLRRGVKIDNLVQIAHNVEVGEDTVIAAQSGIAGSSKMGKHCMLGGQVGIAGHISIADGSIFGAQTGVPNNIKTPGQTWQGYPALPILAFRKLSVMQKQLPDMAKKLYELEKEIKNYRRD